MRVGTLALIFVTSLFVTSLPRWRVVCKFTMRTVLVGQTACVMVPRGLIHEENLQQFLS